MADSYWNAGSDPYQYPGSQVLKNIPDVRNAAALDAFEQRATILRLDEVIVAIADQPINFATWQTIHRILFQDLYRWAGDVRTVQLAKGTTVFAIPEHIHAEAERLFTQLAAENLERASRDQVAGRFAFYFGELNALHPFREGNGRTQKLLFDEIGRRIGYRIDWARIHTDSLLKAVIAAFNRQDYDSLTHLFDTAMLSI
jgi:cell filamentation protein